MGDGDAVAKKSSGKDAKGQSGKGEGERGVVGLVIRICRRDGAGSSMPDRTRGECALGAFGVRI